MANQCSAHDIDVDNKTMYMVLTRTIKNHESITGAIIQIVNCLIYRKKQSLLIETHMLEYEFIRQLLLAYSCYWSWLMPVAQRARGWFVWNGIWNWMTIWTLSLLKFVCTICCNYVLIDAMKYTSGIVFTQTVGV